MLALEARTLTVESVIPAEQRPTHLADNLSAVVCTCTSASGVPVCVMLGGPEAGVYVVLTLECVPIDERA